MKKILLIVALLGALGFSSQANAGVHVSFGVGGGGYYPGYYPYYGPPAAYYPYYGPPGAYYGAYGPPVYISAGYYPWYHGYWHGGYCYRGGYGYHHH